MLDKINQDENFQDLISIDDFDEGGAYFGTEPYDCYYDDDDVIEILGDPLII